MKDDDYFFVSDYTADEIMDEMKPGYPCYEEYAYLPGDLVKDYFPEILTSMTARYNTHTIWIAGYLTSEQKIAVRQIDNELLSNRKMYYEKTKEYLREDLIDFLYWLEEAIEKEDKERKG